MKGLIRFTILALASFGLCSAATAQNLLINPGAEDGVLAPWVADLGAPVAATECGGIFGLTSVRTGSYSFSMDDCESGLNPGTIGPDGAAYAQISQEVDTTGCSYMTEVGDLLGQFRYKTHYVIAGFNAGVEKATFGVTFFDAGDNELASMQKTKQFSDHLWHTGKIAGDIPAYADTAVVTAGGIGVPNADVNPTVWFDDLSYKFTSCVAAYAVAAGKSSCTAGNDPNGGGDGNGKWVAIDECPKGAATFFADFVEAQIGLLEGTDTGGTFPYVGTPTPGTFLHINGKTPEVIQWCHLTPSDNTVATIEATGGTMTNMDYDCEIGGVASSGTGITVELVNPAASGKGRDKDRGYVRLTGPVFVDYTVDFRRGMVSSGELN